jgi:hypothetical protein
MTLMTAWQNAAETYSRAVAGLSKSIGVVSKKEYETLVRAQEVAHKWMTDAQANFEAHVKEHGCGDRDSGIVKAA